MANIVDYIINTIFKGGGVAKGKDAMKSLEGVSKMTYKEMAKHAKDYVDKTEAAIEAMNQKIEASHRRVDETLRKSAKRRKSMLASEYYANDDSAAYADPKGLKQHRTNWEMMKSFGNLTDGTEERKLFEEQMAEMEKSAGTHLKGIQKMVRAMGRSFMPISRAMGAAMTSPWSLAVVAVMSWSKVVSFCISEVQRRTKEAAKALADQWKASAEYAKESFDRVFKFIADGWEKLSRDRKNHEAMQGVVGDNRAAEMSLEHEREINKLVRNGASDKEISSRREEMRYEERLADIERKKYDILRKEADIYERRTQRAKDRALIEKEIIPSANRLISGSMMDDADRRLAAQADRINLLKGSAPDVLNSRTAGKDAKRRAGEEAIKASYERLRKNEADEENDAAEEARLKVQRETLEVQEQQLRVAEDTRKVREKQKNDELAAEEARKKAAEAEKKSEEEAREARRKAIADKREEIRLQQDEVSKRKEAARKTAEDYRDQIAAAKEALAIAQQAAQAQMPTNEDIRAERRRRKHGGYRGGDVGEDGVAGTWDDEKAVKRAERIAEKIRRKRSGQWNGRLSKEDEEFYKQWFDARKGALNAKDLAKQKEALMLAAQNAEIQAAADIAKMQGDIAGLRQDLAALLAAK